MSTLWAFQTARKPHAWVALLVAGVLVAAIAVTVLLVQQHERHAHDVNTDEFWCTLSGNGPTDVGPRTGTTCAELLKDVPGITWGS